MNHGNCNRPNGNTSGSASACPAPAYKPHNQGNIKNACNVDPVHPTCYEWALGLNKGTFTGYAVTKSDSGEFLGYVVVSGEEPLIDAEIKQCVVETETVVDETLTTDCNGAAAKRVTDECVATGIAGLSDKLDTINQTIISEGDQTQALLVQINDTLLSGINVTAVLDSVSATAEAQLQALMEAALTAIEPLKVEIAGDTATLQAAMQAALSWAGTNVQFDVLATQAGTWTVDLSAAAIAAIESAFDNSLSNANLNVTVTNTGAMTVALDGPSLAALEDINVTITGGTVELGAASLASLENITVEIAGQPISVALDAVSLAALENTTVTLDAASLAALEDTNVTVTGGTITLDAATLAALEDTNVTISGGVVGLDADSLAALENITATIDASSVTAIAEAIAGETLTVEISGQPLAITGTVDLGDVSALTDWLAANDLNIDDAAIIAAINAANTDIVAEVDAVEAALLDVTDENCSGDPAFRVISDASESSVQRTFLNCAGEAVSVLSWYGICRGSSVITHLSTEVLSSTMAAHVAGDIVADISAAPFDGYFDAQLFPNGLPVVVDDVWEDGVVGKPTDLDVLANDTGVDEATLVAGSEVDAVVIQNADGTFNVEALACIGSFDYQSAAGCVATVSWDWSQRDPKTFTLSTAGETLASLALVLSGGGDYTVDWGDGNTDTGTSSAGVYVSNAYASAYTGDITVTYSGCEEVTELRSNQNHFDFDVANIPATVGTSTFIVQGQNTISGDVANIPATVGTSTFYVQGLNTISGDVANIPVTVGTSTFNVAGQSTISGDVANIPVTVGTAAFNVTGQNTISGDIANIPATVGTSNFSVFGQNTISGDVVNIPATVGTSTFYITGKNTISGDVANIPATVGASTF